MEILTTRNLNIQEPFNQSRVQHTRRVSIRIGIQGPSKPFYQRVHHIHKTILTIQGKYEYQYSNQYSST